jgi:hypothetical protein
MCKTRRLLDEYRFPGFRPKAAMQGIFGKPEFRVIPLSRHQKKRSAVLAARPISLFTIRKSGGFGICPVARSRLFWRSVYGASAATGVGK